MEKNQRRIAFLTSAIDEGDPFHSSFDYFASLTASVIDALQKKYDISIKAPVGHMGTWRRDFPQLLEWIYENRDLFKDGIVISARDREETQHIVQKLVDDGGRVFTIDIDLPAVSHRGNLQSIVPDNKDGGKQAARALWKYYKTLPDEKRPLRPEFVVLTAGGASVDREFGFRKEIEYQSQNKATITPKDVREFTREGGIEWANAFIAKDWPNLVGIFACNDEIALGVRHVFERNGVLHPAKIVGFDGIRDFTVALEYGPDRWLLNSVVIQLGEMATELQKAMSPGQHANGPTLVPCKLYTPLEDQPSYDPRNDHQLGQSTVSQDDHQLGQSTTSQARMRPKRWMTMLKILIFSAPVVAVGIVLLILGIFSSGPSTINADYVSDKRNKKPVVVVFVHGIFGDKSTWESGRTSFPKLLIDDPDVKDTDAFLFEYHSPRFGSANNVGEVAKQLNARLEDNGVFRDHKHIVFLCHSMGGLVTRRALILKRDDQEVKKTAMIYFYAVPTNGAEIAERVWRILFSSQLRSMFPLAGNEALQNVQDDWTSWKWTQESLKSYCAYEKKPTDGVVVVDQASARALCNRLPEPFDANHVEMVKPPDRYDPRYTRFRTALQSELPITKSRP